MEMLDKGALLTSVKLLAMDVDGVLTDGTLGYDEAGREQKRFHVADGMGLTALRMAGIQVAWLSGRDSLAVWKRARELRVSHVRQGVRDKGRALSEIAALLNLPKSAVAFVGDDWNDLLAFEAAGLRIAVRNADAEVCRAADLITERSGGHGAIREVCDALLQSQGLKDDTLSRYLDSLKDAHADDSSGQ